MTVNADELGIPAAEQYVAFDFWNKTFIPPFTKSLTVPVVGRGCRVLAVRPLLARPFLLSTSRHVSQGILEVRDEKWDEETKTLSGISSVVANDPYELRVVAMASDKVWTVTEVQVSGQNVATSVPVKYDSENGFLRLDFETPTSGDLTWRIAFKSEPRSSQKP